MIQSGGDEALSRYRPILESLAIFGAALGIRLLYLGTIRHAWFFDHLQTEPQHYDEWALAILRGAAPARPPFDEAPAYPYFIALLYWLFGRSIAAVCIAQALLDAATCAAIACIGRRVVGGRRGWIAGALAAVFGPLIYFSGQLEPATLTLFAISVALAATPTADGGRAWRWTVAGTLWGVALLVRSEIAIALPLLLLQAGIGGRWSRLWRAALPPALLLAGSLTLNALSSHHAVLLTTGAGVNLWLGNNPHADGVNPFVHGPLDVVARDVEAEAHDPVEADNLFRDRAIHFLRAEPSAALTLLLKKLAWTFANRELPNSGDIDSQEAQSELFRLSPAMPIGFGLLFPLALAGALLLGRDWPKHLSLIGPIAIGVGTCVLFFTNARFRLTLTPALAVLAALAIDRVSGRVPERLRDRCKQRRALLIGAAGALVGVALSWTDSFDLRHFRVPQIEVNTGALEAGAGRWESAIRHLCDGLQGDPEDGAAWIELGRVLEDAGRSEEARATWRAALERLPDDAIVRRTASTHLRPGFIVEPADAAPR